MRPLGLRRTFVAESISDLATLAPGTSGSLSPDGAPRDARAHYHPGWVWHGVIASTASELVRFVDSLFRGELLSPHSLAQMTELVSVPVAPFSRVTKPSLWSWRRGRSRVTLGPHSGSQR